MAAIQRRVLILSWLALGLVAVAAQKPEIQWAASLSQGKVEFIQEILQNNALAQQIASALPGQITVLAATLDDGGQSALAMELYLVAVRNETAVFARQALQRWIDYHFQRQDWKSLSDQKDLLWRFMASQRYGASAALAFRELSFAVSAEASLKADLNWNQAWAMDLLSKMGIALFQTAQHDQVLRLADWAALWRQADTSGADQAFLNYVDGAQVDLFDAIGEIAAKGLRGDAALYARLLRYPADSSLSRLYQDLIAYRGALKNLSELSNANAESMQRPDPLAGFTSAANLEALLAFKNLVFQRQTTQALVAWKDLQSAAKGQPFASWRQQWGLTDDREFGGILRDLHDLGRQGPSSVTIEISVILQALAKQLRGPAQGYALELAARLEYELQRRSLALSLFRRALVVVETEGAQVDRQRIAWYVMREISEAANPAWSELADLAMLIKDPDYHADIYENLCIRLMAEQKWADLAQILAKQGQYLSGNLKAKYAAVLGRQAQLAKKSQSAKAYWEIAYSQRQSLYYHVMAAYFLKREFQIQAVLDAMAGVALPLRSAPSLVHQDALALARVAIAMGQLDWAGKQIVALRRWIPPQDLLEFATIFSQEGKIAIAVRLADYRRTAYGHVADQAGLSLMYPRPYADIIEREAEKRGVPVSLFFSLLRTESLFDALAGSSAGAQGIAQFMPSTAAATAKAMQLDSYNVFEPESAIAMSAFYVADLRRPVANWSRALASYNAGATRIRQQVRKLSADQFLFNEGLAISETRNYIRRIIESSVLYAYLNQNSLSPNSIIEGYFTED